MERVWRVNTLGVMLCMKHEVAQMLTQGGRAIVNMAPTAGLVGGLEIRPGRFQDPETSWNANPFHDPRQILMRPCAAERA